MAVVSAMAGPKLLVLGATGETGRHVVSQALERGYDVTVLVRDSARLTSEIDRLRVIAGSVPEDADALRAAMAGQDAVISALGVGKSFKSGGLIARSAPAVVRAMKTAGVRRLIFMSAYGVGATFVDAPFIPRLFMRTLLSDVYADKAVGDDVIRDSGLEWTLVHPATLTNGPRSGHYRVGERLALRGMPSIARADVAEFLLAQIEDRTYMRKGVLVSR